MRKWIWKQTEYMDADVDAAKDAEGDAVVVAKANQACGSGNI